MPTRMTVRIAKLLRTLGEPNRLQICRLLARSPASITDLVEELGLAQPLVSHHIKRLREHGFVEKTEPGARTHYRLRVETLRALSRELWLIGESAKGRRLERPRVARRRRRSS